MQHRILPNILVCGKYTACQMTANAVRSVCFCTENSAPLSDMKWILVPSDEKAICDWNEKGF